MHHQTVLASGNFLVPNATFLFELVAFLIILGVLWRYVLPPLNRAVLERQDMIRRQIEDSLAAKERLEAAEREYQEALVAQRREASQVREEVAAERAQIIEEARSEATRQAADVMARAEERLATERAQVLRSLRAEVGSLALELAEKITRSALEDDERARRLVADFVTELDVEA